MTQGSKIWCGYCPGYAAYLQDTKILILSLFELSHEHTRQLFLGQLGKHGLELLLVRLLAGARA